MQYFFNHSLRNLIIAMQTLFNGIEIKRYNDAGEVVKTISVPLKFGPMHKYYMRRMEDNSMQRYYQQLPAMALTVGGFSYAADRARSSKERRYLLNPDEYTTPDSFLSDIHPSPWDVTFTLSIRTESFMDWMQIVEQIIPFFNPSVYLQVKEFNTVNLERDIRVTLNSMEPDFLEEQEEENVRYINGSMTFTADAWFYRPLTDAKVIQKIISTYGYDPTANLFEYSQTTSALPSSATVLERYITSAAPLSATSAITPTGTVTTGMVDAKYAGFNTSGTVDYGYINYMP